MVSTPARMIARKDRSLIAWLLYACVLFNLIACGVAHGQMAGLMLSGLDGQFCLSGGNGSAPGGEGSGQSDVADGATLTCPLCASLTLTSMALLVLAWLAGARGALVHAEPQRERGSPRHCWPPANPRASPLA